MHPAYVNCVGNVHSVVKYDKRIENVCVRVRGRCSNSVDSNYCYNTPPVSHRHFTLLAHPQTTHSELGTYNICVIWLNASVPRELVIPYFTLLFDLLSCH